MKRGGSWNNSASNTRSAKRNNNSPTNRNNNIGFRLSSPAIHPQSQEKLKGCIPGIFSEWQRRLNRRFSCALFNRLGRIFHMAPVLVATPSSSAKVPGSFFVVPPPWKGLWGGFTLQSVGESKRFVEIISV